MSRRDPTCIGRVRHVLGATVTVELDGDLAGVAPIWRGQIMPIGQVGSLVRIPQGPVSLIGSVVLVGISELHAPLAPIQTPSQGDRWLQVQLLGEVDALGKFQRGVSSFPGLDDTVHFATSEELRAVYPPPGSDRIAVGYLSSASDVAVTIDPASMVTRHCAIVGSTGSGKTSAVAALLQNFARGGWNSSNIIVIDPHGEYASALSGVASSRSVRGDGLPQLRVPYWALSAQEILQVVCGVDSRTVVDRFSELVQEARRKFAEDASWLTLDAQVITADSPIPFSLHDVWYQLDYSNRLTVTAKLNGNVCVTTEGNAETLTPAMFEAYGAGSAAPFKGPTFGHYSPAPERLRLRLLDPKFGFFLEQPDASHADPLVEMVSEWLGVEQPISVLDFSGVPSDVADVAIGVILQFLFELATRSTLHDGIGRSRPVLIVLEEAHRYLGTEASARLAQGAVNRIAREGRKYGIGLLLVTQRPSELPDTALSQCGTIISLRLTNSVDQATVRSALPDTVVGLANVLPSLRTGEALISGDAIVLPSRTMLVRPNPTPDAKDPTLESWKVAAPKVNLLAAAIVRWRENTEGETNVGMD